MTSPPISLSGVYQGDNGQTFLVTQGITGYTLVAGKQCLFRLFLDAQQLTQVDTVTFRASSPGLNQPDATFTSQSQLIVETGTPNGPSVGLIIPGFAFPKAGNYSVTLSAQNAVSAVLQHTSFDLTFQPTKDLRLLVTFLFHEGVFAPTTTWYTDIERSMLRLGSMFPVRDGVQNSLNGDTSNGLRYLIDNPCDGYTSGYYDCVYGQTRQMNASIGDHIDVTVEFRPGLYYPDWNPPGDPAPGGNSGRPPAPYSDLRRASCVAGRWQGLEMTAGCVAQEIGHNFGLEPPTSPHYQDPNDPGHSKDPFITDPYAYDFVNLRLYNRPIGDTMNNTGGGAWQGADAVAFNTYDWEYLRGGLDGKSGFMALDSTGSESGTIGVLGYSESGDGILGESDSGDGMLGKSESGSGVFGESNSGDGLAGLSQTGIGVSGVSGKSIGVVGISNGVGVFGIGGTLSGQFIGDVDISGTLTKGGGGFKIDHPLDPANKYLLHSFVESPDMKNVYDGEVVLDTNGEAIVHLPAWFETLNRAFHYQLTPIGAPGPNLYIAEEINDHRFKIAGGSSAMRVCWQVTGIRQDAWAQANRLVVEKDKPADERDYYLHPEAHGHHPERNVGKARHPEILRRFVENRQETTEEG